MTKTKEEVIEQIRLVKQSGHDLLGFETQYLAVFLPYADVIELFPHLKYDKEFTEEGWKEVQFELDRQVVLDEMKRYMSFAWDKANNCRRFYAYRSIVHYKVWLWILGGEDETFIENIEDYDYYGKPHLQAICNRFGFPNEDDGKWKRNELDEGIDPIPD